MNNLFEFEIIGLKRGAWYVECPPRNEEEKKKNVLAEITFIHNSVERKQ